MSNVLSSTGEILTPAFRIHPGIVLGKEIQERGLTQVVLAEKMGVLRHHISDIIHGRRNITPKLAVKLEIALDIEAQFWMNLQTQFDLAQVRAELEKV